MLQWHFVDLMIPAIGLPIPGLIIGLLGLRVLARLIHGAERERGAIATA